MQWGGKRDVLVQFCECQGWVGSFKLTKYVHFWVRTKNLGTRVLNPPEVLQVISKCVHTFRRPFIHAHTTVTELISTCAIWALIYWGWRQTSSHCFLELVLVWYLLPSVRDRALQSFSDRIVRLMGRWFGRLIHRLIIPSTAVINACVRYDLVDSFYRCHLVGLSLGLTG